MNDVTKHDSMLQNILVYRKGTNNETIKKNNAPY